MCAPSYILDHCVALFERFLERLVAMAAATRRLGAARRHLQQGQSEAGPVAAAAAAATPSEAEATAAAAAGIVDLAFFRENGYVVVRGTSLVFSFAGQKGAPQKKAQKKAHNARDLRLSHGAAVHAPRT